MKQNKEVPSDSGGKDFHTKQGKIGVWLIRLAYVALAASGIESLIRSFSEPTLLPAYISLGFRLAAAVIIFVFGEYLLKHDKPVPATFLTLSTTLISLFLMGLISPVRIAWLLGIVFSLIFSLIVIQLMPTKWMGYGIFASFFGGSIISITDFFTKSVQFQLDLADPQNILMVCLAIGLLVLLFTRFLKYPVTAKLVLAISAVTVILLNILGVAISAILLNSAKATIEVITLFGLSYLLGSQIAIFLSSVSALLLARIFTKPLLETAAAANSIAQDGDLSIRANVYYQDEIGDMAESFNLMIDSLNQTSLIAEEISTGNLTVDMKPKSVNDGLGNAFMKMIASLRETVSSVALNAAELNQSASELSDASLQARAATDQITNSMQQLA
ncbi:MAG: hypothetical protein CVU43_24415, partial [Chloroflexi bacterium HGW-Chloroflexi-5]